MDDDTTTTEPTEGEDGAPLFNEGAGEGEPSSATSPATPAEPEPGEASTDPPKGTIKEPASTAGTYMVLVADKPSRGAGRPLYVEVGFYEASGPDSAKRRAKDDPAHDWLRARLDQGKVLLRAVPAQSWPAKVEWSGWDRPEPRLTIR